MKNNNFSISPNLIDQLRISLRREAGFESFNFNDPSLNPPPSSPSSLLNEAIASSSPSSDALRCKDCDGELLRGQDSIICVYCGRAPQCNCIHHSIPFKDSLAFRWFLKALDLDGFERVGIPAKGGGSGDRGRGTVKEEEISLSDFLDLELKWKDESRGFGVEVEERGLGKRYLCSVGVDVEELLAKESVDQSFCIRDEQLATSQKDGIEGMGISRDRNLSLFDNTQTTEADLKSGEGKGKDEESFSDWGADFHSASPSGSNLTASSNKLWTKSEPGPPLNPNVSDENTLVEGGSKVIESVDSSFNWLPADQRPTTNDESGAENRYGDDSFDDWGDFRMSMNDNVMQCEPGSSAVHCNDGSGLATSDPLDEFTGFVASKNIQHPTNSFSVPEDSWLSFTPPITGGDIQLQAISNKPEQDVDTGDQTFDGEIDLATLDFSYLEHQGINVRRAQDTIFDQGDSIGLWSNDIHLGIKGELDQLQGIDSKLPASGTINEHSNSFDMWNQFKGSDNQHEATKDVSSFDVWNDFAGLGVGKMEEQSGSLKVVDGKGREGNDHSIDTWSDFAGISGADNKPMISTDVSSEAWNDFSSVTATLADQSQSSNKRTSEDQAVLEDNDLFSTWGDFRSLGTQIGNNSLGSNKKTSLDLIHIENAPNSVIKAEDNSAFSSWGDIGGATSIFEQSVKTTGAGSSENKLSSGDGDLFSDFSNSGKQLSGQPDDQRQCDGVTIHNGESSLENADSFDAESNFTSSSIGQTILSCSENALHDKDAIIHGYLFDAWNVTVSSPNVQAGKDTAFAMEKTPALKFSNMNLPYVGPTSLMPLDPDVGVSSHQNGSAPISISPPESPDFVRAEHGEVKADGYVNGMNPSVGTAKYASDLKSSIADTLISEMHDLSFMLESSLSIPNSGK